MNDEIKAINIPNDVLIALSDLTNGALNYYKSSKSVMFKYKTILDCITNIQQENERLNSIINKIYRLFEADTHCENIYYAIGVLLNKKYHDIEMIDNKELLNILRGDKE